MFRSYETSGGEGFDFIGWLMSNPVDNSLKVAGLIVAVFSWFKWGWPIVRAVGKALIKLKHILLGRPEKRDSITGELIQRELPDIGIRFAALEQVTEYTAGQIKEIKHEVQNNDGSSLKDSVQRVEASQDSVISKLDRDKERLDNLERLIANYGKALDTIAESQNLVWPTMKAAIEAKPSDFTDDRPDLD